MLCWTVLFLQPGRLLPSSLHCCTWMSLCGEPKEVSAELFLSSDLCGVFFPCSPLTSLHSVNKEQLGLTESRCCQAALSLKEMQRSTREALTGHSKTWGKIAVCSCA